MGSRDSETHLLLVAVGFHSSTQPTIDFMFNGVELLNSVKLDLEALYTVPVDNIDPLIEHPCSFIYVV